MLSCNMSLRFTLSPVQMCHHNRRPNDRSVPLDMTWRGILACLFCLLPALVAAAPRVVVSIAPLHSLVAGVVVDDGPPHLLLRGRQSPHSFSLRPSDARQLHAADALFWIGPELETPIQRIVPSLRRTRSVALLHTTGLQTLPLRDLHQPHAVEPGNDRHDSAHDEQSIDPHLWLSPDNAIAITHEIARVLAEIDPGNAARYHDNAKRQATELRALGNELRAKSATIEGGFAVFHDAFQYLERFLGLTAEVAVSTHPERSPGAAQLHRLRETLANEDVGCLFSEPQFDSRLTDRLRESLPVRHAVLDPLGSTIAPGPDAYAQMMRELVDALVKCMTGDTG